MYVLELVWTGPGTRSLGAPILRHHGTVASACSHFNILYGARKEYIESRNSTAKCHWILSGRRQLAEVVLQYTGTCVRLEHGRMRRTLEYLKYCKRVVPDAMPVKQEGWFMRPFWRTTSGPPKPSHLYAMKWHLPSRAFMEWNGMEWHASPR